MNYPAASTPNQGIHRVPGSGRNKLAFEAQELEAIGQKFLAGFLQEVVRCILGVVPGGQNLAVLRGLLTAWAQGVEGDITAAAAAAEAFIQQVIDAIANALGHPGTGHTPAQIESYLAAIPGSLISGVTGVEQTLVDMIVQKFTGNAALVNQAPSTVGIQLGGFLNSLQTGITGAVNAGAQAASADVQIALGELSGTAASAQHQLADLLARLQPRPPATVVGGVAPDPITLGWGSAWTLSGSAASSVGVSSQGYAWIDSGNVARICTGVRNDEQTTTAYQSVRFLLNTIMESPLSGGSDICGNSLLFRVDSVSSPSNYGELRLYYNRIELWGYSSGVGTLLKTWSITPVWGVTYSLDAGTASGLDYYLLKANGIPLDAEFHDSLGKINTTNKYGGQRMYSAPRGSSESSPGVVGYWKLSDNPPTQKVGSGFKVCRVNTTGVSFTAGADVVPANFYDTVDRMTPDFAWDATQSMITVRDEGWYTFTIALPFLAANGTYNIYGGVAVAIAVDGVIDSFGGPPGNTKTAATSIVAFPGTFGNISSISVTYEQVGPTGVFWTSPPIYCQAGSQVQPVYASAAALTISGGYGTQTAFERTTQYFSGAKLGQVVV